MMYKPLKLDDEYAVLLPLPRGYELIMYSPLAPLGTEYKTNKHVILNDVNLRLYFRKWPFRGVEKLPKEFMKEIIYYIFGEDII